MFYTPSFEEILQDKIRKNARESIRKDLIRKAARNVMRRLALSVRTSLPWTYYPGKHVTAFYNQTNDTTEITGQTFRVLNTLHSLKGERLYYTDTWVVNGNCLDEIRAAETNDNDRYIASKVRARRGWETRRRNAARRELYQQ